MHEPTLSVVVPSHNPDRERLRRTLVGLRSQSLPAEEWETLIIDNASTPAIARAAFASDGPANLRIVSEPHLGLTSARRRGVLETRTTLLVFVDDDNVLAPDYLAHVVRIFAAHPRVGAIGGRSLPEFAEVPAAWTHEFFPLLALRDHGDQSVIAGPASRGTSTLREYPAQAAPIGAGMALRRAAIQKWLDGHGTGLSDRRGAELSSAGDNDIILTMLNHGWQVGYFPELTLKHLIPAMRLEPGYLARLNRGIQQSWMQVLTQHAANPWPPIAAWTIPLRQAKAWFTHRAWSSSAAWIRWRGACGHFAGRAARRS